MVESSGAPKSRTELLARMRTGREEWDALIAQIPDAARTAPVLAGGWTVKDLIAHIAAYENWTAAQIRAATEARAPTDMDLYGVEELPPDPEGWDLDRQNAMIYSQYKDRSLNDVAAISAWAFADLIAAVAGVHEVDLASPDAQSWTGGTPLLEIVPRQCYAHYAQHIEDLRSIAGQHIA